MRIILKEKKLFESKLNLRSKRYAHAGKLRKNVRSPASRSTEFIWAELMMRMQSVAEYHSVI
jgi:hypothetical protein